MNDPKPQHESLDEATQRRLGRLRAMPVDIAGTRTQFESMLAAEATSAQASGTAGPDRATAGPGPAPGFPGVPGAASGDGAPAARRWRYPVHWWRPVGGIAAAVVLLAVIGVTLLAPRPSAVEAAPSEVARLHKALATGEVDEHTHVRPASDIHQANEQLARDWPGAATFSNAPRIPDPAFGRVLSCCVHRLKDRPVATVLMEVDGQVISVMVAHDTHVRKPRGGKSIEHNGYTFTLHQIDGTNLVMIEHGRRWVTLASEGLSSDNLMTLGKRMLARRGGEAGQPRG